MTPDDDLARFLPEAPPRPDRREAAIAEAMRRFDGEAPAPAAPARRPSFAWPKLGRAPLGAAVSLALVAVIGAPLALRIVRQEVPAGPVERPAALNDAAPTAAFEAPLANVPPPAMRSAPDKVVPPVAPAEPADEPLPAMAAPAPAPPPAVAMAPPPPPTPPPPPPRALAQAGGQAALETQLSKLPQVRSAAREQEEVVVTGARVARPDYQANAPIVAVDADRRANRSGALGTPMKSARDGAAEADVSAKRAILPGTSLMAAGRGAWNACTLLDPARSLAACKAQVDPGAKGQEGRAAAYMAQGLSQGWQGDLKGAVAAFDAAIAIEPKRAFFHLNRGIAFARMGDVQRAVAAFDLAIRYARSDPRGYYHRSLALRAMGQDKRADGDEARAIRLDPRYKPLFN